jgi:hypothetical protein
MWPSNCIWIDSEGLVLGRESGLPQMVPLKAPRSYPNLTSVVWPANLPQRDSPVTGKGFQRLSPIAAAADNLIVT